jgi:signal transduction histidine kinase/FixJ family two-component response regulator
MLETWFDDGFAAAVARDYRQTGLRLAITAAAGLLVAMAAAVLPALAWMLGVLLLEALLRPSMRRIAEGARPSSFEAWRTALLQILLSFAWTAPGFILLIWGGAAGRTCAVSFFAVLILFLVTRRNRARTLILAAAPVVAAPLVAAMAFPALFGGQVVILLLAVLMAGAAGTALVGDWRRIGCGARPAWDEGSSLESLKEAKAQAEAASQAKSAFLATMSHEIRTPLNGVLGMTQALAADPSLTHKQRAKLDTIRKSGEALLAILNDVLDLSKIEAGKLELEAIEFDLEEIARGAHAAFKVLAAEKGLEFKLVIDPGAKGVYCGDPTRVRQVLYNLISNGLKFTEQGRIRVLIEHAGRAGLRLTVADSGIGIDAGQLERIFGKFEQADASSTRQYGGTGLGLAICRELCALMGGSITADSEVGRGTRFVVTLPLRKVADGGAGALPARPAEAPPAIAASGLKVLAAEDNATNQLVLKVLLAQIGIEPVMVENGAQAVEAWGFEHFDLILMDIQMPQMDGMEATRAIRQEEARTGRARTPIVALTANAMSHQVAEYAEIGMDAHIAKPIDRRTLAATLQRLLAQPSEAAERDRGPRAATGRAG